MATLDDILDAIRSKRNFLEIVEITDTMRTGSKLRQYEVYFGKPEAAAVTVEFVQIYVNGDEARLVTPCFMCGSIKDSSFKEIIQPVLDQMKVDADKVRILYVDEDEKYALVERTVYNSFDGTASTIVHRVYELPNKTIRVVES
jgi:hypothetical protein